MTNRELYFKHLDLKQQIETNADYKSGQKWSSNSFEEIDAGKLAKRDFYLYYKNIDIVNNILQTIKSLPWINLDIVNCKINKPPINGLYINFEHGKLTIIMTTCVGCVKLLFGDGLKFGGVSAKSLFKYWKDTVYNTTGKKFEHWKCNPEEAEQYKKLLESDFRLKYKIEMLGACRDIEYEHVYHVDRNSSFPAGLAINYPELRPAVESIYNIKNSQKELYKQTGHEQHQKNVMIAKAILNISIGYMQSRKCVDAAWSKLSYHAILNNNEELIKMAIKIKNAGYILMAFNTDGIWYADTKNLGAYSDEEFGDGLGQWKNDHHDCKFRMKSRGCYEFEEDGVYNAVVRGRTDYDEVVPREQWQWGDIYKSEPYIFEFSMEQFKYIKKQYILY